MDLKSLDNLQKIENLLNDIRKLLNPEDSPYICDVIVTNINDEDLNTLIAEMMKRMGYGQNMVKKILKIVNKIRT